MLISLSMRAAVSPSMRKGAVNMSWVLEIFQLSLVVVSLFRLRELYWSQAPLATGEY